MDSIKEHYIDIIRKEVDRRSLLEQLAEEASELAQASLKLIRSEDLSSNPTPVDPVVAYDDLIEEVEDVLIVLNTLGIYTDTRRIENHPKWIRWAERIRNE